MTIKKFLTLTDGQLLYNLPIDVDLSGVMSARLNQQEVKLKIVWRMEGNGYLVPYILSPVANPSEADEIEITYETTD